MTQYMVKDVLNESTTVMTLNFQTNRSGQTVQTQIRLLLEEQSDQCLQCLLFHLHHFDKIPFRFGVFVQILGGLQQRFLASQNLGTLRYLLRSLTFSSILKLLTVL